MPSQTVALLSQQPNRSQRILNAWYPTTSGIKPQVSLPIRREEAGRSSFAPPHIWLIPGRLTRRPLTELAQFCLLPLGLAIVLLFFGLTFQGTIGMPLSRFVHTYTDIPLPKAPPMPQ